MYVCIYSHFFFFNDTATTEIYTLSLHDALPITMRGAKALYLALTSRLPFSNLLHLTTILKGAIMGWVTDNFRKRMHLGSRESNHGQSSNGSFESQADRKWTELVRALELDTEEF